ncbi:FAD-binding and (Fe-S)-binding domain-containing protein [Corynebacterium sp. HS2168-gen11]|uniref:FAD-binding and (Fe-S)-binding domain-containing protein n=1 Tax=Corynebacterium sp. HS2168-gen11 TaxID=2974027 RepID=UPI00216B3CBA|nr:FAD-binding and (Fe-S)-binding domain-containing protein [Corynebacterium sp. HS2168-gen11]MCS4535060.1 FAD-binding oxidoreductase [Corynebacterium sp. HS2168-gen11]
MNKLFTPDATSITQPSHSSQPDAVGLEYLHGSPCELVEQLTAIVGAENVLHRLSDLVRFASDGSPYRRVPKVVVRPRNANDLAALMRFATHTGHHLVFRAAGTSLNGQAMTNDILVDMKTHFVGMEVHNDGAVLHAKPGVVMADAQAVLGRYGYMLGPDPGSTPVCTVGGVVADNAGGMRCTVERDSYHSLQDATIVLPSGSIIDTAAGDAAFQAQEPELHAGLLQLRDRIRSDAALVARLKKKFSIRNTNGIRLDAFIDEDEPVRILLRLMVSSEGIFGALTDIVMKTVALPKKKAVAWVMLPNLKDAANYVRPLVEAGALACELLVAPVLSRSVANFPQAPREWADIDDNAAALLLEVGGRDEDELNAAIAKATEQLTDAPLLQPLTFDTSDAGMRASWQIRNGLFGLIGQDRPQGAALITEDVCFPPAEVGAGAADLLDLLQSYGYPEMVMGHAAYGNLHFFLIPSFEHAEERERYAAFLDDLATLVLEKYDGSLKAEHGTGVNMAPFLLREWGKQAWELMWEVKQLIDPHAILAPNIKLTRSQDIHLQNFKSFPQIDKELNACVECGFCEPICPSRHVTVTPRQRIVLRREMARQDADSPILAQLQAEYQYDAIDMCAADSTCAIACPISIDTGKAMKRLRSEQQRPAAQRVALRGAEKWAVVEKLVRGGLVSAKVLGSSTLKLGATIGRKFVNEDLLPTIPGDLPLPATRLPETSRAHARAVYFPACINRMFGNSPHQADDHLPVTAALVELGRRSGAPIWIPQDVAGRCCGTPWSSKGYQEGFKYQAAQLVNDFWRWSNGGELPIIIDAASCTHGVLENIAQVLDSTDADRLAQLTIYDAVTWIYQEVLPHLPIVHDLGTIAVHPNCSIQHMGLTDQLLAIAQAAGRAVIPDGSTCCGSAGDRVMLHPELVESATREQRASLAAESFDVFLSANRTCEMGLEMITGKTYEHVATLLERASRPVITP